MLLRLRGVLCPSRKTAAAVESYGVSRDRIAIVPPGTVKPNTLRPRRGPVRELLCVANLMPRKGHGVLVEALAQIRDLDWNLLCVGSLERDPPTARSVRRMISAAGLKRRITLAGEWPPQSVAHAYRTADAFVLPSFHEGYGMVFAEAMAHGLPLIATTAGAIPETVSLEAALLGQTSSLGTFCPYGDLGFESASLHRRDGTMIQEIGFARDSPLGAGGRMRRRGFPRIRRFDDAQLGEKAPFILTDSGDFDTKTQD